MMLFHRLQAWNLAHSLYTDRQLTTRKDGFTAKRFEEGFRSGWIRPDRWQAALDMFVIDEKPLLPPDLDIDTSPCREHLDWWNSAAEDLHLRERGRYRLPELRALKAHVIANFQERGIPISSTQFDIAVQKLGLLAEKDKWSDADPLVNEIEFEFDSVSLSVELAKRGVPTYSHLPAGSDQVSLDAENSETLAVAKFYFENQVRVPAPTSFSDALKLRENPRIDAWRTQMRQWAQELASGSLRYKEIHQQISDANDYIEGAGFITKLVPKWSAAITLPLGAYHLFASAPGAHAVAIGLFGFETFRFFGEAIEAAVASRDALKFKWYLVNNES